MDVLNIAGYLTMLLVGLSLGLIGGGGAILTVPILVYLFKIMPTQATGYSLFIVGSTAAVGAYRFIKEGRVDIKTGAIFSMPSFLGVFIARKFIVPGLPDLILGAIPKNILIMSSFAIIMLFASTSMIRGNKNSINQEVHTHEKNILFIVFLGFMIGIVSGFVGAGGGFLIIPALVHFAKLSMKRAIGTSLFIISIQSLLGFTGELSKGAEINIYFLVILSMIAITGLLVGARFSKNVSDQHLKKSFGYFVFVMGFIIFSEQMIRVLN